ncbi:MAG: mandelate racemase/muconate lactonizing enzyme family protein [Candidatus Bathyarchaeia archaeon]
MVHRLIEPFNIAYEHINHARNILVIIETGEGLLGVGEASPLKSATGDTVEEAIRLIRRTGPFLKDADPCDISWIHSILEVVSRKTGITSQTAKTAIDSACFDILGKTLKKPVYRILGCKKPRRVPNAVTVYLRSIEETARKTREIIIKYRRNGLRRLKLKMSGNPKLDKARVLTVSNIFPGELMLDANQAYRDEELAVSVLNDIYDALGSRVILVEQPSPKEDLQKLRRISGRCKIPVFTDESVVTLKDLMKVIRCEAAEGVNIKLQKAGGIIWATKMVELAKDSGLGIMVGCMLEGGVGIAHDAHFLASISKDAVASDLDTDLEIRSDVIAEPSRIPFRDSARIPLDKPGLGIELRRAYASR